MLGTTPMLKVDKIAADTINASVALPSVTAINPDILEQEPGRRCTPWPTTAARVVNHTTQTQEGRISVKAAKTTAPWSSFSGTA